MKLKIKNLKLIIVFLLIFGSLGVSASVGAEGSHTETLTIVKYGLTPDATGFQNSQTIDTGQYINNLPIYDNTGKELKPLANISYKIQEVIATGSAPIDLSDSSSYTTKGNAQIITTDGNGEVSITLSDGFYIVSEQANSSVGLSKPAVPLLIVLPSWDETTGTWMTHTYIYPKSSIDPDHGGGKPKPSTPTPIPTTKKPNGGNDEWKGFLPDTGDIVTSLSMIGFALLFLVLFYKRRTTEEEKD